MVDVHLCPQPRDLAARLQALDPSRSFLVQAPAGSGKTELLTDRILALLPTVSRPEEIVAITFTRKAASEMHARVLSKLQAGLGSEPESEQARRSWALAQKALAHDAERGWNLLHHPARLAISTIDAFCASLVRGMPWLSALGGRPNIVNDASAHYDVAARATLDLAQEYDAVSILLSHLDVDTHAAIQAIASMLRYRDQWLPLLHHGTDRQALQEALAQAICEDLRRVVEVMPHGWHESLCEPARRAAAALDELGADHPLAPLRDWQEALMPDVAHLDRWQAVAHLLLTKDGGLRSPKGVNKSLGFPPGCAYKAVFTQWLLAADPAAQWIAHLAALRDIPPACFTDAQWEVLSAQLLTLALAVAQLQLRFTATGQVDFIEISQRAAAALGSVDEPGELLLKLDASIRHLLIDEFQDTNQTQIDLLATLTSGWQQDDGRTVFLVGDPMQSIYRFRKAEVGLFLQVRDLGLGELRPFFLSLKDNFRSQAGVVAWINRQFGELLPRRDDAAAGAISYNDSNPFHPTMEGPAVTFHAAWGSEGVAAADHAAEELTVALVREALAKRQPGGKPSVAILVRARRHLGHLVRRLAQEGIEYRAVDLVPLARRPVVSDLFQLVRALAHPADRLAWLCVLRAPWCGLTLASLHALFGRDLLTPIPALLARALSLPQDANSALAAACQAEALLLPEEYQRLRHVASILLDRSNEAGTIPFAAWIESLWHRLGGAALYPTASAANDAESLFLLIEQLAP
jgi:ATP-dependent exoDNAse (exonuclease V) beta subunit